MKVRHGHDGIHLFDRSSGLNLLLDEGVPSLDQVSLAPRFVSLALLNACDLSCSFCYAPKHAAALDINDVLAWAKDLSLNGCLGIGFGGGEPLLYPDFSSLCQQVHKKTDMSVSFTTHGNRMTEELADSLRGSVNFVRVSIDGIGDKYEAIRGCSFKRFMQKLSIIETIAPYGVNLVINATTIHSVDAVANLATEQGATELLLLPQIGLNAADSNTISSLYKWINSYRGQLKLAIAESASDQALSIADPFVNEKGTKAYVHVNAEGCVCETSHDQTVQVPIRSSNGIVQAIRNLENKSK